MRQGNQGSYVCTIKCDICHVLSPVLNASYHYDQIATQQIWSGASQVLLFFSHPVVFNSLQPRGLQHTRLPSASPSPGASMNSCPLSWWCHPTISSSVIPFCCLQSFPASRYFLMSQLLTSGSQSIDALAPVLALPMNIQDWFSLGLADLISLLSEGLSRVFSNTTVRKHQFFSA